jgi:nucleoside-diphosphate-sugar epimerase
MSHREPATTHEVRRVLVTGGTGTLGANVVEQLAGGGVDVLALSDQPPTRSARRRWDRLAGRVEVVEGDVLDRPALARALDAHQPDVVVHAAAITPDSAVEADRGDDVLEINVVGTLRVVRAAAAAGVRRVVSVGSVAAYGAAAASVEARLDEEDTRDRPVNLYEVSKHAAELAALRLGELLGVQVVSARVGDVYGRWERVTTTRTVLSGPAQVAARLLAGLSVRLPEPGERYWISAPDAARAIAALALAARLDHRVYNVGGAERWSLQEWARRWTALGVGGPVTVDPAHPDVRLAADNPPLRLDRLHQDTTYRQQHDLAGGLTDYLDWLRETDPQTTAHLATTGAHRPV